MRVLGLSSGYHDASAALVVDGELVFSAAEERFSRIKHDPTFPHQAIEAALAAGGIEGKQLDAVAFHEDPINKLSRALATSLDRWPRSFPTFFKSAKEAISTTFWVRADIANALDIPLRRVHFAPHHMSHTAYAFRSSGLREAAVMTLDAVGEWTCSTIVHARHDGSHPSYELVDSSPFPHSVGLFYSAFASFLGFKVNEGEASVMALASFGEPRFREQVQQVLRVDADGAHHLDLSYFDFRGDTELPLTKRFLEVFGAPRDFKGSLPFDAMDAAAPVPDPDAQRFADIAASVQAVCEEAVLAYGARAARLTGATHLCYGGGVALNCVANQRLRQAGIFEGVHIPPDPGDGGGAAGAALLIHDRMGPSTTTVAFGPYRGGTDKHEETLAILPHLTPNHWHPFSLLAPTPLKAGQVGHELIEDEDALITRGVQTLERGLAVGWVQGRFESGPRALGARSILLRPDDLGAARRLSKRIKLRAPFRPYAASMTDTAARACLDDAAPEGLRWMQYAAKVRPAARDGLQGACHADGTTRPQVLTEEDNPLFYRLLQACGRAWGQEAVLNTSFNERGDPMVADGLDALASFARTELDALAIGPLWVWKERA